MRMSERLLFKHVYNLYEYNVLLFKLTNKSSSFQNFINNTLHNFLNVFCIVYINNILIYSNSKKKHTQHVHQILKRLRVVELQIDIEKCEFSVIEIKYLSLIRLIASSRVLEFKSSTQLVKTWFKSEFLTWVFKSSRDVQLEYLSWVRELKSSIDSKFSTRLVKTWR